MDFATRPNESVHHSRTTEIRPIELLPTDMPEEEFAKVRFLGSDYWIAAGQDGVFEAVESEYVVVEKDIDQVATSTSGVGKDREKHSSEF